tara:strand:+ start:553 stop:864 length:312 start_codon:yes stop_codon:yes gene_type:complete
VRVPIAVSTVSDICSALRFQFVVVQNVGVREAGVADADITAVSVLDMVLAVKVDQGVASLALPAAAEQAGVAQSHVGHFAQFDGGTGAILHVSAGFPKVGDRL